jgi:hypothetical protein
MQNIDTTKRIKQHKKNLYDLKYIFWNRNHYENLYRERLKSKLLPITGEIYTDWLKIKEAITIAAEECVMYKNWKNRKWLRTWNEEIKLAKEENKASYRKYLQNKTVEHYIEYKTHRAIVRKMTRKK